MGSRWGMAHWGGHPVRHSAPKAMVMAISSCWMNPAARCLLEKVRQLQ
jgi:hypothetical protein